MCFAPQWRALFRHLNLQKWRGHVVCYTFSLRNVLRATKACTFPTSQFPKVVRTSVCFVHFDFEMCFAPQRRALFRHLNFQKWSEAGVFCTFWLANVLRATTACNFSSLIWPAGSAPAALASLLFDPPTFSRICIFRLLTLSLILFFLLIFLSSLPLPCSAFHLSILSEVWLLNFLRWLCFLFHIPISPALYIYIYIYTPQVYALSIRFMLPPVPFRCSPDIEDGNQFHVPFQIPKSMLQNIPSIFSWRFMIASQSRFFLETALLGYLGSRDPEIIKHSTFNQAFNSWNCVVVLLWFQYRSAWVPDFPLDVLGR